MDNFEIWGVDIVGVQKRNFNEYNYGAKYELYPKLSDIHINDYKYPNYDSKSDNVSKFSNKLFYRYQLSLPLTTDTDDILTPYVDKYGKSNSGYLDFLLNVFKDDDNERLIFEYFCMANVAVYIQIKYKYEGTLYGDIISLDSRLLKDYKTLQLSYDNLVNLDYADSGVIVLDNDNSHKLIDISNYIPWDSYFMGIALMARSRSKDPSTQVGACIVKNNRIISTGYNGFPTGCSDNEFPWDKGKESPYDNKYYYVVHAELNAILNCKVPMDDAILYVTMFPCNECIKAIIQSGIKKVIYYEADKKYLTPGSKKMLKASGIETEQYKKINRKMKLEL